jgi:hypothetical protein
LCFGKGSKPGNLVIFDRLNRIPFSTQPHLSSHRASSLAVSFRLHLVDCRLLLLVL